MIVQKLRTIIQYLYPIVRIDEQLKNIRNDEYLIKI